MWPTPRARIAPGFPDGFQASAPPTQLALPVVWVAQRDLHHRQRCQKEDNIWRSVDTSPPHDAKNLAASPSSGSSIAKSR